MDRTPPDDTSATGLRRLNPRRFIRRHHFRITLFFLIVSFFLVLLWNTIVVPVYAGHQGVYWSRFFGGTREVRLPEGTHLKFPWDDITSYDLRLRADQQTTTVLTRDGMLVTVGFVAQYRAEATRLPELHRTLGPDYPNKVVIPAVITTLRQLFGNYEAADIYSHDEFELIGKLDAIIRDHIERYPITFQAALVTRVELPKPMADGIVDKLLQEQRLLAYTYRLGAEEQERQRKEIEARGIRSFESISGISMLKWRGLDVTAELAKSPNAKIIIMGTGPNGLPLILNAEK